MNDRSSSTRSPNSGFRPGDSCCGESGLCWRWANCRACRSRTAFMPGHVLVESHGVEPGEQLRLLAGDQGARRQGPSGRARRSRRGRMSMLDARGEPACPRPPAATTRGRRTRAARSRGLRRRRRSARAPRRSSDASVLPASRSRFGTTTSSPGRAFPMAASMASSCSLRLLGARPPTPMPDGAGCGEEEAGPIIVVRRPDFAAISVPRYPTRSFSQPTRMDRPLSKYEAARSMSCR